MPYNKKHTAFYNDRILSKRTKGNKIGKHFELTNKWRIIFPAVVNRSQKAEIVAVVAELTAPLLGQDIVHIMFRLPTLMEQGHVTSAAIRRGDEGSAVVVAAFLLVER